MSSVTVRRWIARAVCVLLVCQVAALVLVSSSPRIDGAIVGHSAGETTGDGGGSEADGAEAPLPGSGTSTSATGESPPEVTAEIVGPLGANQWYVGDVSISWTVSDAETPAVTTEGCEPQQVTEDTTGATFTCVATSEGGSRTTTARVGRDTVAPSDLSVTTDIDPAASGWYIQPFVASWHGADATSGVDECTIAPYSGPDTGAGSLSGTCADRAGNDSEELAFAFKFDATAPTVTGVADREPDRNGWYNHDVTVTWRSSEPDAVCDDPVTHASGDSASAELTGQCVDPAGHAGTGTFSFKFDETAPVIVVTRPADAAVYILNQPVTAGYSCEDVTSGVDTCVGTVDAGAAIDTARVGSHEFRVEARDVAGNTAVPVERAYEVQYQPAGVMCGGVAGHTILEPITKRASFKHGSTVPAKFRVCDYFGTPVTAAGVVESFTMRQAGSGEASEVPSTSAHDSFRAGSSQWIFNIDTKPMSKALYDFEIGLDDGTTIPFAFTLR